jgi:hypothetical protein
MRDGAADQRLSVDHIAHHLRWRVVASQRSLGYKGISATFCHREANSGAMTNTANGLGDCLVSPFVF